MLETNKIYCIDALEGLKQLEDNSVSAIFTDPPYNEKKNYGELTNDNMPKEEYIDWCKSWFAELKRVSPLIVFTCGSKNLPDWCAIERPFRILAWYKPNAMMTTGSLHFFIPVWEPILVYTTYKHLQTTLGVRSTHDAWNIPISIQKGVGNHPAPKSLKLWLKLIAFFTNQNDLVLDPFMGIGTTAVAAKKLKRKFIGFEISPDYCKISNERLIKTQLTKNLRDIFV